MSRYVPKSEDDDKFDAATMLVEKLPELNRIVLECGLKIETKDPDASVCIMKAVCPAETGDIERALLEEAHGGDGRSLETATAAGQLCFENFNKKMNALIQQEVKSRGLL